MARSLNRCGPVTIDQGRVIMAVPVPTLVPSLIEALVIAPSAASPTKLTAAVPVQLGQVEPEIGKPEDKAWNGMLLAWPSRLVTLWLIATL